MPSQIRITILLPSGRSFEIPVIPDKIQYRDGGEYGRQTVLGLGEISFPSFRKVQEISFASFFPYRYDSTYCQYSGIPHPLEARDFFLSILRGTKIPGRPDIVRLIVTEEYEPGQVWPIINDLFVVESFEHEHVGGELTDLHYSLSFHSARVATLTTTGSVGAANPPLPPSQVDRPPQSPPPIIVVDTKKDSVVTATQRATGEWGLWRNVADINSELGPNPFEPKALYTDDGAGNTIFAGPTTPDISGGGQFDLISP